MRTHYMDALRSSLMLLGVVYHTALIFKPMFVWRVAEADKHAALGHLSTLLHAFRMPAFFIVAGYFSILLIKKYGENGFLRARLQRIGLPLITTAVLINPWTNHFSANTSSSPTTLFSYIASGEWIVQLWFLNALLVFCLMCFVCFKLRALVPAAALSVAKRCAAIVERWPYAAAAALTLALPLLNAVIARVFWRITDSEPVFVGIVDPGALARFLPYFLFGCALWYSRWLTDRFTSTWFWILALLSAGVLLASAPTLEGKDAPRYVELARYLASWGLSAACMALFRRWLDRPSRVFLYLSDASYSVYLAHMLFVVLFGSLFVGVALPPLAKFGAIALLAGAASLACHHLLIRRFAVLGLLFNGKWGGSGKKTASLDAALAPQKT